MHSVLVLQQNHCYRSVLGVGFLRVHKSDSRIDTMQLQHSCNILASTNSDGNPSVNYEGLYAY